MQDLPADVGVNVLLNHTHAVFRSAAPRLSVYCTANVCADPDPLPGLTAAAATVAGAPEIVQVNVRDTVTVPSNTLPVTVLLPIVVGVPLMRPLVLIVNPAGRPVAEYRSDPPSG